MSGNIIFHKICQTNNLSVFPSRIFKRFGNTINQTLNKLSATQNFKWECLSFSSEFDKKLVIYLPLILTFVLSAFSGNNENEFPNKEVLFLMAFCYLGMVETGGSEKSGVKHFKSEVKLRILEKAIQKIRETKNDLKYKPSVSELVAETGLSKEQIYNIGSEKLSQLGVGFLNSLERMQEALVRRSEEIYKERVKFLRQAVTSLFKENQWMEINFRKIVKKINELGYVVEYETFMAWLEDNKDKPEIIEIMKLIKSTDRLRLLKLILALDPQIKEKDIRSFTGC